MSDDLKDFVELTEKFNPSEQPRRRRERSLEDFFEGNEPMTKFGQKNQYALYADGYKATTSTIKSLPAAVYDIKIDDNGIFVVPTPAPSGLLLDLPEMRSDEVLKTVERFWDSEKDYKAGNDFVVGGASYKAGVMLYGPPGSGKSSIIKLVSRKLVERGGTVFFSSVDPHFVCSWLQDFATVEPNRKTILILEDIDSLIQNFGEARYLEMLDSAKTIDNVLFIATTNYPENLDPRIYNRPGRFSHVIKVGYPSAMMREAYLKAVLKKYDDVEYIVKHSDGFTIDHLSALVNAVYREKKDLKTEIERLKILFRVKPTSEEDKEKMGII